MKSVILPVLLVILMALPMAGCARPEETPTAENVQEIGVQVEPTATATLPEPTATLTPEPTLTPTPTRHPLGTQAATVPVENLNLRAGPGTVYVILNSYSVNTELFVVSRIPGNEWVRVIMPDEKTGWMSAGLLGLGDNVNYLPWEEVTDSIMVSGRVIDSDGKPVDRANIAVLQRLTDDTLRTDAVSGEDGYWYAYIPKESVGTWEVQLVGVDCASWIYNENCNLTQHYLYNYRFIFIPPPISPFLFMFQKADAYITGTVSDADGKPASIRVFAERGDGAYVYILSNEAGEFTLPAGAGVWKVYSMQYNPNLEGESVTVQVEAGVNPEPVSIKVPVQE